MTVRLSIQVKPRSSRSRLEGLREDGALIVALKAPPVDGAANTELIKLLSRAFGVAKREVTIVTGKSSRRKIIELDGVTDAELTRVLDAL